MDPVSKLRYAVVGLGWTSQDAVLPAFRQAQDKAELVALVSGDPGLLREVGDRYGIAPELRRSYQDYAALLHSGAIDAVYLALPWRMHAEYAIKAARAGVHVLCETPMAATEQECGEMIRAAGDGRVRLMLASHANFDACHRAAIDIARSGRLGELRFFDAVFSINPSEGDVRLQQQPDGGPLYDLGTACIHAARTLMDAEPEWLWCVPSNSGDPRFLTVDEMNTVVMRFPGDRIAQFTVSFGMATTSSWRMVGTHGDLRVEPAWLLGTDRKQWLAVDGEAAVATTFPWRDPFVQELRAFTDCVVTGEEPEACASDGLTDVRIVRALLQSAHLGRVVHLGEVHPEHGGVAQVLARVATGKGRESAD